MEQITINFNGQQLQFNYFKETFAIGNEANSPTVNVYPIISTNQSAKDIVGEGFIVMHELGNDAKRPYYSLNNGFNTAEHDVKSAVTMRITNR